MTNLSKVIRLCRVIIVPFKKVSNSQGGGAVKALANFSAKNAIFLRAPYNCFTERCYKNPNFFAHFYSRPLYSLLESLVWITPTDSLLVEPTCLMDFQ